MPLPPYTPNSLAYKRRKTRTVRVGSLGIGGANPLRIQSMTTTDTMDVEASVAQITRLAEAGCELVRLTAPTVAAARALEGIKAGLYTRGIVVPLVADIHFQPEAAMAAADYVEKIRINPGNFAQGGDIQAKLFPLLDKLKRLKRCLRIGVNHGSLSQRILDRYGDTPKGMVESALEYARLCERFGYQDLVFSMKSSNVKVMIAAYRLLAARMAQLGMDYPFHLGVTEAGEGEDGRIKSAIGIGSLLEDGIGDTLRVSLTEEPEAEIPVCKTLAAPFNRRKSFAVKGQGAYCADFYSYSRRDSHKTTIGGFTIGADSPIRVVSRPVKAKGMELAASTLIASPSFRTAETARQILSLADQNGSVAVVGLTGSDPAVLLREYRLLAAKAKNLAIHIRAPRASNPQRQVLESATLIGALLCDGIGDSVEIDTGWEPRKELSLAYNILQAAGARLTKTEFVSCPGCGRTLYDLQAATARVKKQFSHLKGLKIAVMGCIVNGPGEMADADFGYVGGAPGKINLYVGKECLKKGVPERSAVQALKDLIKSKGKWREL
ncbi:MAG: (E)-4-hydroxy-3-methylbut-2-enyl-diphosphate synthase [Elusimicrobia bacterium]|nr:(E)-4-hydroxy-3-methylbut-2-enyl-diphosphate synthase [Elusimicrobiota bacterium]